MREIRKTTIATPNTRRRKICTGLKLKPRTMSAFLVGLLRYAMRPPSSNASEGQKPPGRCWRRPDGPGTCGAALQLVAEREEFGFERRRGTGGGGGEAHHISLQRSIIARNHQPISRRLASRIRFPVGTVVHADSRVGPTRVPLWLWACYWQHSVNHQQTSQILCLPSSHFLSGLWLKTGAGHV